MQKYILFFFLFNLTVKAQLTQTVKGKISDKEVGIGLPGVIVQLKDPTINLVTTSDNNGNFKLVGVPVGRRSFLITFTGYRSVPLNDIIVTSGKEMILNVEM